MLSRPFTTRLATAFVASLAFLAPFGLNDATADEDESTTIELVAYGSAQETQELFRYDFASDTFTVIGVVTDQDGRTVIDIMSMAYIPSGLHKGLYAASEESPFEGYLIKIDPLTAEATVYSQPMGWSNRVAGMTAIQSGGDWLLLATDKDKDLFTIDPATGVGTYVCGLKNAYKGLAVDTNGLVYGAYGKELWAIDVPRLVSGDASAEWKVGQGSFNKVEALEFAFADVGGGGEEEEEEGILGLELEGGGWLDDGLLLGFSENTALIVVNPSTGESVEYPCSFATKDFEGLVFLDVNWDGWGQITVTACD